MPSFISKNCAGAKSSFTASTAVSDTVFWPVPSVAWTLLNEIGAVVLATPNLVSGFGVSTGAVFCRTVSPPTGSTSVSVPCARATELTVPGISAPDQLPGSESAVCRPTMAAVGSLDGTPSQGSTDGAVICVSPPKVTSNPRQASHQMMLTQTSPLMCQGDGPSSWPDR